jgi:hypothetical protein
MKETHSQAMPRQRDIKQGCCAQRLKGNGCRTAKTTAVQDTALSRERRNTWLKVGDFVGRSRRGVRNMGLSGLTEKRERYVQLMRQGHSNSAPRASLGLCPKNYFLGCHGEAPSP